MSNEIVTRKSEVWNGLRWMALCLLLALTSGQLFRRLITRLCYTSPNTAQILSQCVYCDYYSFPATTLACTGTTALTNNLTSTQALCIINSCFAQYPQNTQFAASAIGRKRRDAGEVNELPVNSTSVQNGGHRSDQDEDSETVVLHRAGEPEPNRFQVVQEVHTFLEVDSDQDFVE